MPNDAVSGNRGGKMNSIERVAAPAPAELSVPSTEAPPPVYYPYPVGPPRGGGPSLATVALLAILLLIVGMAAVFFLAVLSMMGVGGRAVGDVGRQAGETVRSASDAAARVGQDLQDQFDASHPPRDVLAYDAEIDELLKLSVGQPLPGGGRRAFVVSEIKSRTDGNRPEVSRFAVLHSELRQPTETKVFGITVRRDSEPRDDYLYQGEAFRIGGQVYKVNWISPERQQLALVQLRNPDRSALPLKFVHE